jgi:hypothetical protein
MAERITEHSDGTTERVVDTGGTTIIERRGSGAGILIGLAILILAIVGAVYLYNQNARENMKTDAVEQAAGKVGDAAKDVGDAAKEATKP